MATRETALVGWFLWFFFPQGQYASKFSILLTVGTVFLIGSHAHSGGIQIPDDTNNAYVIEP